MDVAGLRDRIQATLDANGDNRRQAELDLKYVRFATFLSQSLLRAVSVNLLTGPVVR